MNKIKHFLLLLAANLLPMATSAQVINGDMNHNTVLDVGDVTMVIDGYLTGTTEVVGPEVNHYYVDYNMLAGTWYRSKTDSFTLNTDGTTDYGKGYTYKFLPSQGCILFFNSAGRAATYLKVIFLPADKSYLVVKAPTASNVQTYYNQPIQPVESITLSQTSLALQLDSDPVRLTATVVPADADNTSYEWASSDESVVTVSSRGTVEAVGEGTATITCTALDGFGATATCEVTVGETTPTPQPSGTTTYTVNGVSFKMVSVSGGTFKMGSTDSDADPDEKPVHNVTLSDYQIGETEVTQALWQAVMGTNPSNWLGDNLPVEKVSWNDCQEFITKLNQATGKTFRLPTEAEWEFAARGGTKSQGYKYSGSNTLGDVAWYTDNSNSQTHVVATKQPNELGLYDMSGNVREWCQDWFGDYSSSAQSNPTGATSGSYRVIRGGCWIGTARGCRVTYRSNSTPTLASYYLGFRLAQ